MRRKTEIQNTIESMDCVAYYRVSTEKQGLHGLGIDAQKAAVKSYIAADKRRKLIAEFEEVESGKNNKRPEIHKAIALCKARKARLVIAKLDRLARNVLFIAQLMDSGVEFTACDLPEANKLTIHIMAAMAQQEAEAISTRVREALARSKKKLGGQRYLLDKKTGKPTKKLWNPGSVAHLARAARKRNAEERNARLVATVYAHRKNKKPWAAIGAELAKLGHYPPAGGQWHPAQVKRILG